jgi:hypothetical protein
MYGGSSLLPMQGESSSFGMAVYKTSGDIGLKIKANKMDSRALCFYKKPVTI